MPSSPRTAKVMTNEVEDTAEEPAMIQNDHLPSPEPLRQHHTIVRREVGVPFMDTQPTILINSMESVALEKLDSVLVRFKCCKCDRCKKDILALALNKLPAKYMVLQEGQPTPDLDPQTNAQVLTAMIQAVLAVRAHPRH